MWNSVLRGQHIIGFMDEGLMRSSILFIFVIALSTFASGQAGKSKAAPTGGDVEHAANLAESGHCPEALPLLKRALRQATDHDLKKRIGLDGLRCAMMRDVPYESLDFLSVLTRDFPRDPDVLYAAT